MKKIYYLFVVVALAFASCDPTEPINDPTGILDSDITTEVTLDASTVYTLDGTVRVKEGGVLNIPAGTVIKANAGFASMIMVEQGGKINANGTAEKPVIFTANSDAPEAGYWGGIVINGYAPIQGGETATCEMDVTVSYGGNNAADNSGTLTYVVLEYTGAQSSESVEHNGLTLDAVGSGTTINNLFIYKSADDAIEFFGGTVDVSNLLSVSCDDDMFDVTQGWTGKLTNAYGAWEKDYISGESDPRGVEADGNFDGLTPEVAGQSNFTIENLTVRNASTFVMTDGLKIRRGATATITNALLVGGTASDLIDLTDGKGDATTATSISATIDAMNFTDNQIKANDTYNSVEIVEGNTGCDASIFSWTSFDFTTLDNTLSATLNGDVTTAAVLDASVVYTLDGTLTIKDGGSLTIPAGTVIEATEGFASMIMVEQGGKIYANGTADAPVIFTAANGVTEPGYWGGLVINGYAPIQGDGTQTATCEMDASVIYGGNNAEDNSGTLTYVVLKYTGAQSSESVEHNGLTLDAVGSGTTINNIFIYKSADDAIEFFGGSVNVTNLLSVSCDDDMFDVTQGWNGTLENAYGVWESDYLSGEGDPRGVEADGNFDGLTPDIAAQSNFTINNLTIKNLSEFVMTDGIKIRRGATAKITNALIVGGTASDLVDMTDSKGDATTASAISVTTSKVNYVSNQLHVNEEYASIEFVEGNTGCDASLFSWTDFDFSTEISQTLSGTIAEDTYLNGLYNFTLDGTLTVEDGASLFIAPGSVIKATEGFASMVMVKQGGKIYANGTAVEPITFTAAADNAESGYWGGLVINGKAPISGPSETATCEMDANIIYGGTDANDNSGALKYVILNYTGAQSSESVEHNGLTLDAVGNGTTIENIFIYKSADDAIEFFGGSVNVTNLLSVSCDDDMFDVTQGWTGTLDNAYGKWESDYISGESDPRGIEADGNFDGLYPDAAGQSNFTMSNITINNASEFEMTDAIKVRRGATATISNALIMGGTTSDILDLTDGKGDANTATSISATVDGMTFTGSEIHSNETYANVAIVAGNTGATVSAFNWTSYNF